MAQEKKRTHAPKRTRRRTGAWLFSNHVIEIIDDITTPLIEG